MQNSNNTTEPKEPSIYKRWREQEIVIIHKTPTGVERVELSCDENDKAIIRVLKDDE